MFRVGQTVWFLLFLRLGLSVQLKLASNSQESSCLNLWKVGITGGVSYHARLQAQLWLRPRRSARRSDGLKPHFRPKLLKSVRCLFRKHGRKKIFCSPGYSTLVTLSTRFRKRLFLRQEREGGPKFTPRC